MSARESVKDVKSALQELLDLDPEGKLELTIGRAKGPPIRMFFMSVQDCKAFVDFELELIQAVKKKTIEECLKNREGS